MIGACGCAACTALRADRLDVPRYRRDWLILADATEDSVRIIADPDYTRSRWPIVIAARAHAS